MSNLPTHIYTNPFISAISSSLLQSIQDTHDHLPESENSFTPLLPKTSSQSFSQPPSSQDVPKSLSLALKSFQCPHLPLFSSTPFLTQSLQHPVFSTLSPRSAPPSHNPFTPIPFLPQYHQNPSSTHLLWPLSCFYNIN